MNNNGLFIKALDMQKIPKLTMDMVRQILDKAHKHNALIAIFYEKMQENICNVLIQEGYDVYICKLSDEFMISVVSWQRYEEGRQGDLKVGGYDKLKECLENLYRNSAYVELISYCSN